LCGSENKQKTRTALTHTQVYVHTQCKMNYIFTLY
jgi:hypothetical protein